MKMLILVGSLLVLVGVVGLIERGFSYTTREEVARVGPIEVTAEREKTFSLPPAASAATLVVGLGLVGVGLRRHRQ